MRQETSKGCVPVQISIARCGSLSIPKVNWVQYTNKEVKKAKWADDKQGLH